MTTPPVSDLRRTAVWASRLALAGSTIGLVIAVYEMLTGAPEWRPGARVSTMLGTLGVMASCTAMLLVIDGIFPPTRTLSRGRWILAATLFAFSLLQGVSRLVSQAESALR